MRKLWMLTPVLLIVVCCSCMTRQIAEGEGSLILGVTAKDVQAGERADVYVGEKLIGEVSLEANKAKCFYLENGEHVLRIVAEGYEPYEDEIIINGTNPSTYLTARLSRAKDAPTDE